MDKSKESVWDEAVGAGMDMEFWRIRDEIDRLIEECNVNSSYGRGQRCVLRKLKERIENG